MQIVFNIAEDSNVELVKGEYELVQGECCVTELKFNFPATIKGVAIENYKKHIEFGECKDLGECVKFVDDIDGDTYELNEYCTAFKKIMVQVVLTYNNIKWKTIPVMLEFYESVNAEGHAVIQAQILSLAEIERKWQDEMTATKNAWESFITANTLRMIYRAGDVPTADASSLGDTIFYLGANTDTAPLLVYGHYYRCNYVNGAYEWTDLTQDASLADVANGVREINKNQTLQFWKGATAELENEVPQENVAYIAEDITAEDVFKNEFENRVAANAKNAEQAETADKVDAGISICLVSNNGFFDAPDFEEGAIYAVTFIIDAEYTNAAGKQAFTRSSSGIFVANNSNEYYIPLRNVGSDAYMQYNKTEGEIYVSMGYSYNDVFTDCKPYPNKLLFYKIGSTKQTIAVSMGNELGAYAGSARYELFAPQNTHLGIGVRLSYNGETAEIVEYEDGYYTILCDQYGEFATAAGKTITVEVEA